METISYLRYNLLVLFFTLLVGSSTFYWIGDTRYIKFQLVFSLIFSFISLLIFTKLKVSKSNDVDKTALGLSMLQSLVKLILSLGILIPFYQMYCPTNNIYLFNFIFTYIAFMVLDNIVLSGRK